MRFLLRFLPLAWGWGFAFHASDGMAAAGRPAPASDVGEGDHVTSPDHAWEAWVETASELHPVPASWNVDAYPKEGMPLDRARIIVRRKGGAPIELARFGPGNAFDPRSESCHSLSALIWSPDSRRILADYTVRMCESDADYSRYVVVATVEGAVHVMAAADLLAACTAGGVTFGPHADEFEPHAVGFAADGRLRIRFDHAPEWEEPPRAVRRCTVPASSVREAMPLAVEGAADP